VGVIRVEDTNGQPRAIMMNYCQVRRIGYTFLWTATARLE